jgi:hypothetical protein
LLKLGFHDWLIRKELMRHESLNMDWSPMEILLNQIKYVDDGFYIGQKKWWIK